MRKKQLSSANWNVFLLTSAYLHAIIIVKEEKMQKRIGDELRALRIKNNLDLMEVADRLSINCKSLIQYEQGIGLSVEKLEQLLKFYHVDPFIFLKDISVNMHNM